MDCLTYCLLYPLRHLLTHLLTPSNTPSLPTPCFSPQALSTQNDTTQSQLRDAIAHHSEELQAARAIEQSLRSEIDTLSHKLQGKPNPKRDPPKRILTYLRSAPLTPHTQSQNHNL